MSYRLVATDMDGTLLTSNKRITPRAKAVIAELRAREIHLVLSSARPVRTIWHFHEELGLTTPVIAGNGALIWAPGAVTPIAHNPIARDIALRTLSAIREAAPAVCVCLEMADLWHVDRIEERFHRMLAAGAISELPVAGDLERWIETTDRGISKLYCIVDDATRTALEAAFETYGVSHGLTVTTSGGGMVEIMGPGVTKGAALASIAAMLDVPMSETVALGDGENDIPALQMAGLGIAMGNASDLVKQHAARVALTNDADGWADALERWVLAGE